jgi:hypothetical protein
MPESLLAMEQASSYHTSYHSYAEIMAFTKKLARPSNPLVDVGTIGKSSQNRVIPLVAIGNRNAPYAMYVILRIAPGQGRPLPKRMPTTWSLLVQMASVLLGVN